MESLPRNIINTLEDIYGVDYPKYWYNKFALHFINTGIPEIGVIGLLKRHKISVAMVKRYGKTGGLIPENVAQIVLKHRHDIEEYDSLAKPRIRITKKKIADYRKRLEEELRRIWIGQGLEDIIRKECLERPDEEIAEFISMGLKPEIWARNLNDI